MLKIFRKTPDYTYKTAYLIDKDNERKMFKYYRLEKADIEKINIVKGIRMQEESFAIKTTSTLPFNKTSKIIINGTQYHIDDIETIDSPQENGLFISNMVKETYLTLGV